MSLFFFGKGGFLRIFMEVERMAERENPTVREMSAEERNNYQGITIDEQHNDASYGSTNRGQSYRYGYSSRPKLFHLNLSSLFSGRYNFLMKIAMVVGAAAIAAFLFFVVLPSVALLIGVGVVIWFLLNLLR